MRRRLRPPSPSWCSPPPWSSSGGSQSRYETGSHTTPPKDARSEIVLRFVIPERLRPAVGLAPCPICSLGFPKYFEGMLCWFPDERALRAIGHECGREFFGEGVLDKAIKRYERTRDDEVAQTFLIENLPKVASAKALVATMLPRARVLDKTRNLIRLAIGNTTARNIARAATHDGHLRLYVEQQVPVTARNGRMMFDADGDLVMRSEYVPVDAIRVVGTEALKFLDSSTEAHLNHAESFLRDLRGSTDDEVQDLLIEWGIQGRQEAVVCMRKGWASIGYALEQFHHTRLLLQPENVEAFGHWARDSRCLDPFKCAYTSGGRLEIGLWGGKHRTIPIGSEVLDGVPNLPPLT